MTLGTVASVATAVVAVSAAVGAIGLAVTAVGLVTGNEDVLKAGEIMGYVGLAGGVAGGLIGGFGAMGAGGAGFVEGAKGAYTGYAQKLSEGWDAGVGSWFKPDVGAQAMGPVNTVAPNGVGNNLPAINPAGKTNLTGLNPGITPQTSTIVPPAPTGVAIAPTPVAPVSPMSPVVTTPLAPVAPAAPEAGSVMPDWMKYSAITTAGQGVAGMMGGMFQGEAAEKQVELEQQKMQQDEAQRQLINRNNAYSPRVTYNSRNGLINR